MWNLALDIAHRKQRVLFVTLELTAGQLGVQALSRFSRIPLRRLAAAQAREAELTEQENENFAEAAQRLAQAEMFLRIHSEETHGSGLDDVIRSATRNRFDAVFIDHIGMVGREQGNELEQLARCINRLRGLKSGKLVANYRPFVCATSPLNREGRKDESEERLPQLGDFRGSSRIDYDADLAMILRKRTRKADDESDDPDIVDAFVVKNRFGRCPVMLQFEAQGAVCTVTERQPEKANAPQHWQESER
jgi:replicative DNA helicase